MMAVNSVGGGFLFNDNGPMERTSVWRGPKGSYDAPASEQAFLFFLPLRLKSANYLYTRIQINHKLLEVTQLPVGG